MLTFSHLNNTFTIFQEADHYGQLNDCLTLFEEVGGVDKLEELQCHSNDEVYQAAAQLIGKYFSADEDEQPADVNADSTAPEPTKVPNNSFSQSHQAGGDEFNF